MSDDGLEFIRPRWGTFSVIDHKDKNALVSEILLYDRLVFPVPPAGDKDEWARWTSNGWDPELSQMRLKELGDLAHPIFWTNELRSEWTTAFKRLKAVGTEALGLGSGLTSQLLGTHMPPGGGPPPIPIAAFQSRQVAVEAFSISKLESNLLQQKPIEGAGHPLDELHLAVGVLFERLLQMPNMQKTDEAFKRAVKLAHDDNFRKARRRLFAWEDRIVCATPKWPVDAAVNELAKSVDSYNKLVGQAFKQTWIRRVWRAVKIVAPAIATAGGLAALPPFGVAAGPAMGITLLAIECRFPQLDEKAADPSTNPAAALSMAMSAMSHE